MRYNNYHKHTHESNRTTLDCVVKPIDYINRAIKLGHNTYFTTEHGWTGKYLESYDLCKDNNLKMIYGVESYIVLDRKEKDNKNYHIVVIGKNQDAFYELNEILSEANKSGYYYKPRIDSELILRLHPENFIITTACVAGLLRDNEGISQILEPIVHHFNKSVYLEIQNHSFDIQKQSNIKALELYKQYGLTLIHGNDSHYISCNQVEDRNLLLKGKGMDYGDEDSFLLDYPDYDTIIERYNKQNVLTNKQIIEAINNTLIFDDCEELYFDKEIKMPTIYPNIDKNKKLTEIIINKFQNEIPNINPKRIQEYKNGIAFEYKTIKSTDMADYFLFNEAMVDLAVNKYHGILSRTGRGSGVSYYINKLLGLTEIDRFESEVPLYPTRFMSEARILQTKSLPDIDQNWADVTAPILASKELLGEDCVYYMYALGTMKEQAAFRNLCRAYGMQIDEYNEIAKNLDAYREDKKWKPIIDKSQVFIGTIDSISPSPCSFVLSNKSLSRELGLIKIGDVLCACIDGYTADVWKYLKNDYLTVRVWKIISNTYKLLNKSIPNIKQLKKLLDNKVWELYEKGLTATLNQADTDISTSMLKRYKPKSVAELSAFVAAIRPGFASLVNQFLNRENYSTGIEAVDQILEPSYHYMLYQESIMAFLVWCGMKEDHTYDIIKKISKKKFTPEQQEELRLELLNGFIQNTSSENGFEEVWQVVNDAARYSFNASHSLSVAWDSLYGAELKAHYPLEYYTVVLNEYRDDNEKTSRIISELSYFNIELKDICFGKSLATYTIDKENNSLYKGISSIKYCNSQIADDLMALSKNKKCCSFTELLSDIKTKTSLNSRQLTILTGLNFFSTFGNNKYLLNIIDIYDKFSSCKQINKNKLEELGLTEYLIQKYSAKETTALYKEIDNVGLINELCSKLDNKPMGIIESVKFEKEYLEYVIYTNPVASKDYYIIIEYKTYKDVTKPYFTARSIKTGDEIKSRVKQSKIFKEHPFGLYNVLQIKEFDKEFKKKNIGGNWVVSDELEDILSNYEVIK
jgi:DNA polymerase III alpha subunit